MTQLRTSLLTIANVVSLVGTVYYLWGGFPHLFAVGTGSQPTAGTICIILFLIVFFTAIQVTPKKPMKCPQCGWKLEEDKT